MTSVQAIGSDDVTGLGIGVTVALVIIGVLLALLIAKAIARIIIAVVVVVLAIFVWQQRGHIENEVNARACNLDATFFGVHLDPPDDVKQACRQRGRS